MTKKRKQKPILPDEVFVRGPIRLARYGNHIVYESNWEDGEFTKMQENAGAMYPAIVAKIDKLVEDIASLVQELPPKKLLHRAWGEFAVRHMKIETEADLDLEDITALRMIDYIQSLIASVTPSEKQRQEVSEKEWQTLRAKIDKLFSTLNGEYQICRTAKAAIEDASFDIDEQEFFFKAQLYWCNIRGDRYQIHEIEHLRDLFVDHSAVFEDLFGITAHQFVNELEKMLQSLTFGLTETLEELHSFQQDSLAALEAKLATTPNKTDVSLPTLMQEVISENQWQSRQEQVIGRFFGTDLFDIGKVTSLPQELIDELSWRPGEETTFLAGGEFRGWPLRVWPIFMRPFICLEDRYYCFDVLSLFDKIYRVMQRAMLRLKPDYLQTWNTIQQRLSEELPFAYLQRVLRGATVHRSVYYRWYPDSAKSKKNWCETDGLLIYDDHLFIIEVRAGAFTYTPPATDFDAYINSLKNLVLKPSSQGKRFLDYLESAETVSIFDRHHNKIGEIRRAQFRQITICPVTLDPFTEMAAQVQHLRKIGVDVGNSPVWAISLDDLRVYAEIFENPLHFLHYVEQRMRAFESEHLHVDDELDHLGLYLEHNNYSDYAATMRGTTGRRMSFTGYRREIDKFFRDRLYDPATPCPLKQDTPSRILEIIALLSDGANPGRSALTAYILDLGSEAREGISDFIDNELDDQQVTKRPKSYSSHGGAAFTVFCYTRELGAHRGSAEALDQARAILFLNNDTRRLLLELSYTKEKALADVRWQWITRRGIPEKDLPRLLREAEHLRKSRVAKSRARMKRGKIGRNMPCPCGSGKKYKKCCLYAR